MTVSRVFVDTNVFVYSVDRSEPRKEERAIDVIDHVRSDKVGAISSQVIAEFICASRRLREPLTPDQIDSVVDPSMLAFTLVPIDAAVVREALRCWRRYSLSYWDAQIWAAARIGGIDTIVTEDCHMPELEGVRYVNPFAEGFALGDLGIGVSP